MRCDEFEIRLNEVLDQRRQPEADVGLADHSRQCGKCRALATSYQAVLEGLERSRPIPSFGSTQYSGPERYAGTAKSTGDLTHRVLAALAPAQTLRFSRRRRLVALAAAAVVLFVIVPWSTLRQGDRAARPSLPIAETAPSVKARPTLKARPIAKAGRRGIRESSDVAGPYRLLARETTASLSVAMQLLPVGPLGKGNDAAVLPREAASTTTVPAEWVHGLTDGLTPVTRPTAGVMGMFIELLSAKDEDGRS
jgi:hypothetical protein